MDGKPAIVLPLDGSDAAATALGAAQALTNSTHGVLHIVHAIEARVPEDQLMVRLKVGPLEVTSWSLDQVPHDADGILSFARDIGATMIVASTHGTTDDPESLIGGTARALIQEASLPILLIRSHMRRIPGARWAPRRLLIPLNGSPEAAEQTPQVLELAALLDADVDVLNVAVMGAKRPVKAGAMPGPRYEDYAHRDVPAWADEFLRRFCVNQPPGVELTMWQSSGDPVDAAMTFSAEHGDDIIVLGWHGHLEGDRARTVKGLVQRTEVPLMLIRIV